MAFLTTRRRVLLALSGLMSGACRSKGGRNRKSLTLFGAASSTDVMSDLATRFQTNSGIHVRTSFASSANLARQIISGAPADLYLCANPRWMDTLAEQGLLRPGTRRDLLANRIVLIAPADRRFSRPGSGTSLADAFDGKLALADPAHAPAGRYAKEALTHLGWWPNVEKRVLPCRDVRGALSAVETGAAGAGVVYSTDAAISKKVTVIDTFPEEAHSPIRYPIAILNTAAPQAKDLLTFLTSSEASQVYERAGFSILTAPTTSTP